MVFDKLYAKNDILETAMQASVKRNNVILSNIANADTPNYIKKKVDFEDSLTKALDESKQTGVLDLGKVQSVVKLEHKGFKYRLDGNNVDIETEMVDLYQNSIKYDTMASGVIHNYKKINLVLGLR